MAKQTEFDHPPKGHVGLLVYDSVNNKWYAVLGDANGHIQLDVLASALPSGAATAAKQLADGHNVTVDNVSLAVTGAFYPVTQPVSAAALPLPSGAATATNQGTEITALQSIQNLVGALHDVGVDELDVQVIASALPADAATQTTLALVLTELATLNSTVQGRRGDHIAVNYDDVPGDTSLHDLLNVSGQGTLEWLNLASDHASTGFVIVLDGAALYCSDVATPSVRSTCRITYLQYGTYEESFLKLICYDAANSRYGLALSRPLFFNTSVRIRYLAGSATAKVGIAAGYYLV